ncbi:MAG: MotA/TolQ/ExbB proton channel family protein, partial [Deltaproteobacteria bacterium]|nr:MotA/TolQ/ExbB proton channel family protein [Deltaproteobacteria bacterium]
MQIGTETGIIIIAFAVMLFVFAYFWRAFSLTQSAASIVTVIGILGTFVGIAYGLYEFNPAEIEISIPNLLAGLKIAFVTSIFGIFLSVILKFRAAYVARKAEKAGERAPTGATIDDLAASLWKIYESQKEEAETTRKSLASIENALTGEGETTVVT